MVVRLEAYMTSITLKDVPPDLHQRLKASAERNRRSINQEAQALIEAQLGMQAAPVQELIEDLRQLRTEHPVRTTDAEVDRLKRVGRM
jgi:antitoxin FitA